MGRRFDPRSLTDALVRSIGDDRVRLSFQGQSPLLESDILCTGGFPARLARQNAVCSYGPILWSVGDGLDYGRERGAETAGDLDEFYGRAMPAVDQSPRGTSSGSPSSTAGTRLSPPTTAPSASRASPRWSETDLVQQIARWPGGRAWYTVEPAALAGARP